MNKNHYDILGVEPEANFDQIKSAYKRLAKEHHPDQSDAPDASETFQRVKEAYDTLSDYKMRREYDDWLKENEISSYFDKSSILYSYYSPADYVAKPTRPFEKKTKKVLLFLGMMLEWVIRAIAFLLITPIWIATWCAHFVRFSLPLIFGYVLTKFCILITVIAFSWFFGDFFEIIPVPTLEGMIGWIWVHILGMEYKSVLTNEVFPLPHGGATFFPYPRIEFVIIFFLLVLITTIETRRKLGTRRYEDDDF